MQSGIKSLGDLATSGLKVTKEGKLDWYMSKDEWAKWGTRAAGGFASAAFNSITTEMVNTGSYAPGDLEKMYGGWIAVGNWAINNTVNVLNMGWTTNSSGDLDFDLGSRGLWKEALMNAGVSALQYCISFGLEGGYTGYGGKKEESFLAYAFNKALDMTKYGIYQKGWLGEDVKTNYDRQNVFDLAGGMSFTVWQNADSEGYMSAVSLSFTSKSMRLTNAAGEFSGFAYDANRQVWKGFETIGRDFNKLPFSSDKPLKAMADNLVVDENEQKRKLEKLWEEMSKKYAGYGSSSPTKEEIDLLEWANKRDGMHSKVAPVATADQKAYFDERYIEWQSMEALERIVNNTNETNQLSGVYEVKKGDTLWKIAKEMGLNMEDLLKLNPQLKGRENYIRPGEFINLSVDNMDREEFNRVATKEEIERSRRIGGQRERGENNYKELYNDLLDKGIVISSSTKKLTYRYGVPKDDLRLLSDLGMDLNNLRTKEINGEILLEDSIGNRIRIDKSGNISYGLGRTGDLIFLDSNGLRETYKEYITSQMVVGEYVKIKAKYGKDSEEWEAIDKILENRFAVVSLGTAFPIANVKAWMKVYLRFYNGRYLYHYTQTPPNKWKGLLQPGKYLTPNSRYTGEQAANRLALPKKSGIPQYRLKFLVLEGEYKGAPNSLPFNLVKPANEKIGLGIEFINIVPLEPISYDSIIIK